MMGYAGKGRGVNPLLCEEMFARIAAHGEKPVVPGQTLTTYAVKVSFLEIYNEKVQDLLLGKGKGSNLKIIQDPKRGPVVKDLSEHVVTTWEQVEKLLDKGMETRSVAATAMNDTSSRSHAVVQLSLDMEDSLGSVGGKKIARPRRARANLVDLAGSEKVSKSKVEGAGLKEAIGINQSLTCLGRVIDGLIDGKTHVPYRDSVLTCLLSDSLGGNSRTTMLAALSPAAINYEETMSTLRYAARARKIVNKVKVNEDPAAALIRELQEELGKMKQSVVNGDIEGLRLALGTGGGDIGDLTGAIATRSEEIEEMVAKVQMLEAKEEEADTHRAEQWAVQRQEIEEKHATELDAIRLEQEELGRAKRALEEEQGRLQGEVDQKRQVIMLDRLRQGGQVTKARQQAVQSQQDTDARSKKLKRDMLFNRYLPLLLPSPGSSARLVVLHSWSSRSVLWGPHKATGPCLRTCRRRLAKKLFVIFPAAEQKMQGKQDLCQPPRL